MKLRACRLVSLMSNRMPWKPRAPFVLLAPLLLSALIAMAALWASPARAVDPPSVQILVPAYFYPAGRSLTYWDQMVAAAPKAPIIAILNPGSGPGTTVDSNYTRAVNRLRTAGGRVIGYVPTGYGSRPIAAVTQDILKYQNFYSVDGIFLDEMGNDGSAASLSYYASLYQYIKGLNPAWRVIGNPGTSTQSVYLSYPSADAVVIFEDSNRIYQRYQTPTWIAGVAPAQIGHLVTNVADFSAARSALSLAQQRRAGLVYLTNDKIGGNPWDTLPAWWGQLVTEVCTINGNGGC